MPRVASRTGRFVFVLLLAFAAPRGRAHAEEACGVRGWPWVQLAGAPLPAPFDAGFRALLVAQLRAGLLARQIELCTAPADGATSEIALSVAEGAIVTVAVRDALTGKRLAREVPLASVPPDARPLTVALAVDELLRAGWVELALPDAPAPTRPVPREIVALLPAPSPVERPRWEIGAQLAAEHFGGGTVLSGIDLVARGAPVPLLSVQAALGLRGSPTVHAVDGDLRTTAIDATVGVELVLPPRDRRAELALGVEGRVIRARFSGEARGGALGSDATATALYVGTSLRGSVRLTRAFGLSLAGGFGLPVHAVDAFDGNTRVAGLSGPLLAFALGGWWRWP